MKWRFISICIDVYAQWQGHLETVGVQTTSIEVAEMEWHSEENGSTFDIQIESIRSRGQVGEKCIGFRGG
jgi:hypothetical protein